MVSGSPHRGMMRDEGQTILRTLVCCDARSQSRAFSFDVRNGLFVVLSRDDTRDLDPISGPMTLASYNELKLSQYLIEDAEYSTRYERQFSITDRGRHLMEEGTSRDS